MVDNVYTVIVDMDDVLVDLLPAWLKYLNKRFKLNVKESDITEWDMRKAYPNLSDDILYGCLGERTFWATVKPINGAVVTLYEMINNPRLNVKICTAAHFTTIAPKLVECLFRYFDYLTYKDVIVCSNKELLVADYRIDDNPDNLRGSGKYFLVDKPYNQNNTRCHYRVNNLTDAYEIIKKDLEVRTTNE